MQIHRQKTSSFGSRHFNFFYVVFCSRAWFVIFVIFLYRSQSWWTNGNDTIILALKFWICKTCFYKETPVFFSHLEMLEFDLCWIKLEKTLQTDNTSVDSSFRLSVIYQDSTIYPYNFTSFSNYYLTGEYLFSLVHNGL